MSDSYQYEVFWSKSFFFSSDNGEAFETYISNSERLSERILLTTNLRQQKGFRNGDFCLTIQKLSVAMFVTEMNVLTYCGPTVIITCKIRMKVTVMVRNCYVCITS